MSRTVDLFIDSSSAKPGNHGPMTTLFVQPTSCLATPTLGSTGKSFYAGHMGSSDYFDPACYPTAAPEFLDWGFYHYSPAICPGGWEQVTTFISGLPRPPGSDVVGLGRDITAALCCPSGYPPMDHLERGYKCSSSFSKDQVVPYVHPRLNGAGQWEPGPVSTTAYASTGASIVSMHALVVMWEPSDSALLAAAQTTMPKSQASLSTGAKTGIGISVPLAVFAALAIGWFLVKRRIRHKHASGIPPRLAELTQRFSTTYQWNLFNLLQLSRNTLVTAQPQFDSSKARTNNSRHDTTITPTSQKETRHHRPRASSPFPCPPRQSNSPYRFPFHPTPPQPPHPPSPAQNYQKWHVDRLQTVDRSTKELATQAFSPAGSKHQPSSHPSWAPTQLFPSRVFK